jgi:NTE family protein
MTAPRRPRVGLALGSGSARGWAHIGVIRALEKQAFARISYAEHRSAHWSVPPTRQVSWVASKAGYLKSWVLELRIGDVLGFMDLSMSGGVVKGDRLMGFFRRNWADRSIDQLGVPFGTVATSLHTGGSLVAPRLDSRGRARLHRPARVIRPPVRWEGSLLVDGGLVPYTGVAGARQGADIVIAVDLGSDILGRRFRAASASEAAAGAVPSWMRQLKEHISALAPEKSPDEPEMPSILDVLTTCMDIVEVRIARSRMAGEPPEVVVAPRLARLRLLDFDRAKKAIEEGHRAVERVAHNLAVLTIIHCDRGNPELPRAIS